MNEYEQAQYDTALRLFASGVRPFVVTHKYHICPLIATRAWEVFTR